MKIHVKNKLSPAQVYIPIPTGGPDKPVLNYLLLYDKHMKHRISKNADT